MLAIGLNGEAPWNPADRALSSQYLGICCMRPDAPLSSLIASGSPLLSHHITLINRSSSSLSPYSAKAPRTVARHLSTFSPCGESTRIMVGVGSGVGIRVGNGMGVSFGVGVGVGVGADSGVGRSSAKWPDAMTSLSA